MNKLIIAFLAIILAVGLGAGIFSAIKKSSSETAATNTNTRQKTEANITIESPQVNETVDFPFTAKGQARVFESALNIRLKDYKDNVLFETNTIAAAPDAGQFGLYEEEINYLEKLPEGEGVILEAFDYSAKDGSEIDLVSVPIKLRIGKTSKSKLYFNNNKLDPEISCNKVFAVERIIASTSTPAAATIRLLLGGTTASEYAKGYSTNINMGVKLQKLTVETGTAYADFDGRLEYQVGGSCRVASISAQITETLKQFPTVKKAVISINGRTEDILQP